MSVWKVAIVVVVAGALSACGTQPSAGPQFSVNGHAVSVKLYTALVAAERQKIDRTGASITITSATGQQRENRIEASVIRELVRDTVVEQLAAGRGISLSPAELQTRISAVEQALGGRLAFEAALAQAGLSRADFSTVLRYRLLEAQLTQAGSAASSGIAIDRAVDAARVVVTLGPCAARAYPSCVTSA